MKKKFFLFLVNLFMFTMATILGGGGIAMAVEVGEHGGDTDPNEGTAYFAYTLYVIPSITTTS